MLKYLQLPFNFDAKRMQEEVQSLENHQWQLHYQKLHYEGDWRAIPLRSVKGKPGDIIVSPVPGQAYEDSPVLAQCPYLQSVLDHFKFPLESVRLLKLGAGAVIKTHRDAELNFERGAVRIHVPVITHPAVEFILDNERLQLKEGECWYMNFNLPHHISNNSPINRVHLVLDGIVNDWLRDLFASPAISIKKEIREEDLLDAHTKKEMIRHLREMNTETSNAMAASLEKELAS